ncbi:MAG: hypothetical protein AAF449_17405, partial [Myxococcota bacterium]
MKPELSTFEGADDRRRQLNPELGAEISSEISRQAARCTTRGFSPPPAEKKPSRAAKPRRSLDRLSVEEQLAEEATNERRSRRLLATLIRNGRADGEDQAEIMLQLLRGRQRLPAGNFVATMALSGRLAGRR